MGYVSRSIKANKQVPGGIEMSLNTLGDKEELITPSWNARIGVSLYVLEGI